MLKNLLAKESAQSPNSHVSKIAFTLLFTALKINTELHKQLHLTLSALELEKKVFCALFYFFLNLLRSHSRYTGRGSIWLTVTVLHLQLTIKKGNLPLRSCWGGGHSEMAKLISLIVGLTI